MEIKKNFNIRKYNTFDIDCCCSIFVESDRTNDFLLYAQKTHYNPEKTLMLGGGSNLLFTKDYAGTILYPSIQGIDIVRQSEQEVWVRAGSGVVWDDFVAWTTEQDFRGIENLSYIPGHVGASPVQNVGAYGMEAGRAVVEVEAVDMCNGEIVTIKAEQCEFSYRDSMFKHTPGRYLVTNVTYKLSRKAELQLGYGSIRDELQRMNVEPSSANVRKAVIAIRQSKLPEVDETPSAGSFFKNPVVEKSVALALKDQHPDMPLYEIDDNHCKLAAGWLIDQCGWKGKKIGRAAVHAKQALVLINLGGATGSEIIDLAHQIQSSVLDQFHISLSCEVNIL